MKNKILYAISEEDVNTVTQEIYDREPSKEEIEYLDRELGDFIDWFTAVEMALEKFHNRY